MDAEAIQAITAMDILHTTPVTAPIIHRPMAMVIVLIMENEKLVSETRRNIKKLTTK